MHSICVHSRLLSNHCENSDKVCDVLKKSKSNQSTLRASFQHAGCLTVHTEARAVGMYKNCTKEEALKLAYEHISGKVGERWKHTQSQP